MKQCPRCGYLNVDCANYCARCGFYLNWTYFNPTIKEVTQKPKFPTYALILGIASIVSVILLVTVR